VAQVQRVDRAPAPRALICVLIVPVRQHGLRGAGRDLLHLRSAVRARVGE